ncbi:thioesterase family protein [Halobellus sp. GM3]|uniref:thioesterase family protein n=1 Tax=Halobellus sp. GM3 TaxID=3458410 RepID=UPI00403DDF2E
MSAPTTELPFVTEQEIRFRDLDALGHVNNVVYATYCEQSRVRFFEEVLDRRATDIGIVVAHLELDYRTPIDGTGTVRVTMDVSDVGDSSFEFEYEISFEGEIAATGSSVQVAVDEENGSPAPIPQAWRTVLTGEH